MEHHYRFRIHRFRGENGDLFQLRVGMDGEKEFGYLPVHCTAFARSVDLEAVHTSAASVHFELSMLLQWMESRHERR